MTPSVLAGVLIAWGIAQVALGVFFCLVFAAGRREFDYLLFGLMCFALALTTGGVALGGVAGSLEQWLLAAKIAHVGAIAAPVLNLHFALRYGAPARERRIAPLLYAGALVFELGNFFDFWWQPGSAHLHTHDVLGVALPHGSAAPTGFALAYYVATGIQLALTEVLFFAAYRRGNREALIALFGGLFVCAAGVNDILLVTGVIRDSPFVQPHAFMLYAFAVASTLVIRYRLTAGALVVAETNLRLAAEELRVSQTELAEVQSTLETKEQLAAVGELAASIAHEVRNPLAVISNAVAGLRRAEVGGTDRRMLLDIVEEEAGRLNGLVTDLLRFARPATLRPAVVDLSELAEAAAGSVGAERHLDVRLDLEPVRVMADAGLLRIALGNLVENACQASPEGGIVTIAVSESEAGGERQVRIEVTDQGSGMDEGVLARASDPFYTTRPSGTGLGLPIVQRIVRAHGGKLELESQVSRGTTARLVLPAEGAPESARSRGGDRPKGPRA